MTQLLPREIVAQLDKHIVGQEEAKRAVAIALRNRWRRQMLESPLREEVRPKNILMIGPTGIGKTEIARRLAKLENAPFLKVDATKFTEVGYVGRDVEQIVRDLVESAIMMLREMKHKEVALRAKEKMMPTIVSALLRAGKVSGSFEDVSARIEKGEFLDAEIEVELEEKPALPMLDVPGMPSGVSSGMMNLGDMFGKLGLGGGKTKKAYLKVKEAMKRLEEEEADKLLDKEKLTQDALDAAQNNGIVFIDEIDKVCARSGHGSSSGDVSREGVQRDLLPLIEGTTVTTRHGPVQTNHILFIASGAFHTSKPSDLMPELQGRLPVRVELKALTKEDFRRILVEPEHSLVHQTKALLETEGVTLIFAESGIEKIAEVATQVNSSVENIGARRLHTIMERVVEDVSFHASDAQGVTITIDAAYVESKLTELVRNVDLTRFIL